jgi:hypothetical protein
MCRALRLAALAVLACRVADRRAGGPLSADTPQHPGTRALKSRIGRLDDLCEGPEQRKHSSTAIVIGAAWRCVDQRIRYALR